MPRRTRPNTRSALDELKTFIIEHESLTYMDALDYLLGNDIDKTIIAVEQWRQEREE